MVKLLLHQTKAVDFILSKKKCILADDMGLGKTISSIAGIIEANALPCVVVCPPAVKLQWENEVKRFGKKAVIFNRWKQQSNGDFIIVPYTMQFHFFLHYLYANYGLEYFKFDVRSAGRLMEETRFKFLTDKRILKQLLSQDIKPFQVKGLIADEAHFLRSHTSIQTNLFIAITKKMNPDYCIFLTGTPVVNRPNDLEVAISQCTSDYQVGSILYLMNDLNQERKRDDVAYKYIGYSEQLRRFLYKSIMLRREKIDFNLPPKNVTFVDIPIDKKKYSRNKKLFLSKSEQPFYIMNRLFLISGGLKIKNSIDKIKEIVNNSNGKVIVFAYHRRIQDILARQLNCNVYRTALTAKNFQTDPNKVAVLSLKACSVGLNLQFASTAIFFELFWTPAELEQAENRVHRIGQTQPVDIYYFIGYGSLDKHLLKILSQKELYFNKTVREITKEVFANVKKSSSKKKQRRKKSMIEKVIDYMLKWIM